MKDQILELVGKRKGLMGMELPDLIGETVEVNAGMIKVFYAEQKRGRRKVKGNKVCAVCSTKVADEAIEGGERYDLENGLSVIFE
jgi:hypothetical protein